jgi:hypothetical protein
VSTLLENKLSVNKRTKKSRRALSAFSELEAELDPVIQTQGWRSNKGDKFAAIARR